MPDILYTDFETYSSISIKCGNQRYLNSPDADIVVHASKQNSDPTISIDFTKRLPRAAYDPATVFYAHNALFDYLVWNILGVKKYGFPKTELSQWRDSMALCGRYGIRLKLEHAAQDMNLDTQKLGLGKALIKKISCPNKDGKRPVLGIDYTQQDFDNYVTYGLGDVDTMTELIHSFPSPKLSTSEQEIWELTQRINMTGLPIDLVAVKAIQRYTKFYVEAQLERLPELTDGFIQTIGQIAKIKDFCARNKYPVNNMQKDTVTAALADPNTPKVVRDVLEMRSDIGKSSIAKYTKILELCYDNRVHNNLCYHGAGPGRWTGRGFQMHNLPRASVKDPESYIKRFIEIDDIDQPVQRAQALIRPMICAPESKKLLVADYNGIENVMLHWFANDEETLDSKRRGLDQYKEMASALFGVPYDKVTKDQRQLGKIIILGCGYAMAAYTFRQSALGYDVILTMSQAVAAVSMYRSKYHRVVKMWWALSAAVKRAIDNPGSRIDTPYHVAFKVMKDKRGTSWLVFIQPSKRNTMYRSPKIIEGKFGLVPSAMGVKNYAYTRLELSPSRIIENIIQGVSRDTMAEGQLNVEKHMPETLTIGSVHDENISEIFEADIKPDTLERYCKHLCDISWIGDMPLTAEGYIAKRYRKD